MLTIRQEQQQSFRLAALDRFVEKLSERVADCFSTECQALGPQNVREVVRNGILRARGWGFTGERDIAGFVDMIFLVSPEFDKDPRLPWIAGILRSNAEPHVRMERLWIGVTKLLEQLSRPRD